MNQGFTAMTQGRYGDYEVEVIPIRSFVYGTMMTICAEEGPIYITKAQAMKFFNLVPADTGREGLVPDCGEAGHDKGCCGNAACLRK